MYFFGIIARQCVYTYLFFSSLFYSYLGCQAVYQPVTIWYTKMFLYYSRHRKRQPLLTAFLVIQIILFGIFFYCSFSGFSATFWTTIHLTQSLKVITAHRAHFIYRCIRQFAITPEVPDVVLLFLPFPSAFFTTYLDAIRG